MSHRFLEERLFLYLDGDLALDEQARCEEHLRVCSRCRERVDTLRAIWRSGTAFRVAEPPLRLRVRFEAALRGEASPAPAPSAVSTLDWIARPILMAATLVVGILIGSYLGSGPAGETAQGQAPVVESNGSAFTLAEDLQGFSAQSVGQDYLLLEWEEPAGDPER